MPTVPSAAIHSCDFVNLRSLGFMASSLFSVKRQSRRFGRDVPVVYPHRELARGVLRENEVFDVAHADAGAERGGEGAARHLAGGFPAEDDRVAVPRHAAVLEAEGDEPTRGPFGLLAGEVVAADEV